MTIKNKLILSYVLLTLFLTSFWITCSFMDYNTFIGKIVSLSVTSLSEYSGKLFDLSKSYIEPFSEDYIKLKTQKLVKKINPIIKEAKNKENIICSNNELIETFQKLMFVKKNIVVGYSYLINSKNQIIMSPNKKTISITKNEWKDAYPELYSLIEKAKETGMSKGYYRFYDINNYGTSSILGKKYGVILNIPQTDYYLGTTVFLENYKLHTQNQKKHLENKIITKIEDKFRAQTNTLFVSILLKTITIVIIIVTIFIILGYWLAKNISDPIHRLTNKVKHLNSSNLNFSIDKNEYETSETKELSNAFKFLGDELMEYMENLKKEVNERQIIDRDLEIAREIQDHALPKVTNDFCSPEFNIYGELKAAKKVAGDFYDFYYLDKNRIAILIGDVSGKGISAAYFMAKIKTLLKAYCLEEKENPANVLYKVNNILSSDNKSCMFATVFLGYYDIKTGILAYANAGHHAAIKLKKNGTITEFGEQKNVVLGFFEDSKYNTQIEHFSKKEIMILYTDGICEATNSSTELYGKVRFCQSCIKHKNENIKDMVKAITKDTLVYEGKTQQTDDITILGLRRIL
jgi:serine phosphatase RsbU (regulator of sigma subunit)